MKWVGFNFAPRGYAPCDGQLMSISSNQALFALLGTTYGGNGQTTFALPDMRGRMPVHRGQGPGLTPRTEGELGGSEVVTLSTNQMPAHTHTAMASVSEASAVTPLGNTWGSKARVTLYSPGGGNSPLGATAITSAGGGQPHDNMPPYTTLNCIIAVQGIFPSRQ